MTPALPRSPDSRLAFPVSRPTFALLATFALVACAKDKEPVKAEPEPTSPAPSATASSAPAPTATTPSAAMVDASFLAPIGADAGLTPREDEELASILTHLDAPCASQAVSIAQCIAENRVCPDCGRAARYLASGVHQGWPAQYVKMAYRARFDSKEKADLAVDGSPTQGPATAPITIVEFGSYLCSHCAAEAPKLDALQRAHPKDIRLVFKPSWSPQNAPQVMATRAALGAAMQGKFWEMHALLFANQPKFDPESIDSYAKSIGLDTTRLHIDMGSTAVTVQMKKDVSAAIAAHVDSLPSIWINGRGFLPFENLESRIAFELAGGTATSGTATSGTSTK